MPREALIDDMRARHGMRQIGSALARRYDFGGAGCCGVFLERTPPDSGLIIAAMKGIAEGWAGAWAMTASMIAAAVHVVYAVLSA